MENEARTPPRPVDLPLMNISPARGYAADVTDLLRLSRILWSACGAENYACCLERWCPQCSLIISGRFSFDNAGIIIKMTDKFVFEASLWTVPCIHRM